MGNGPVGMILGAVGGFVVGGPAGAAVFIGAGLGAAVDVAAHKSNTRTISIGPAYICTGPAGIVTSFTPRTWQKHINMSKNLATKVVFDRDLETVGFTSAAKEEISKLAEQSFHSDGSIIEKHEIKWADNGGVIRGVILLTDQNSVSWTVGWANFTSASSSIGSSGVADAGDRMLEFLRKA